MSILTTMLPLKEKRIRKMKIINFKKKKYPLNRKEEGRGKERKKLIN